MDNYQINNKIQDITKKLVDFKLHIRDDKSTFCLSVKKSS